MFCNFDAVFGRIPHSNFDKLKDLEAAAGVVAAVAVAVIAVARASPK